MQNQNEKKILTKIPIKKRIILSLTALIKKINYTTSSHFSNALPIIKLVTFLQLFALGKNASTCHTCLMPH